METYFWMHLDLISRIVRVGMKTIVMHTQAYIVNSLISRNKNLEMIFRPKKKCRLYFLNENTIGILVQMTVIFYFQKFWSCNLCKIYTCNLCIQVYMTNNRVMNASRCRFRRVLWMTFSIIPKFRF